ncbi:MAG: dienelactone hydrolase [Verrucomicrobia bacterium]|nr:dienelactone hydrolase [Verrucomicrobiota bacterium]
MRATLAVLLACLHSLAFVPGARGGGYDPLPTSGRGPEVELTVSDLARSREIPLLVYLPKSTAPAAVVLFSHGLGGARTGSAFLGRHWAGRGYVAVFLQHPGSDAAVWQDAPRGERYGRLVQAASLRNFVLRARDVPAVLDQLTTWNAAAGHPLAGRLDLRRVGLAGHSFGAVTTQAVAGQRFPLGVSFTEPRIRAALPMSPSPPKRGEVERAFGSVRIPWLLMTGTKDEALIGGHSAADRQRVYPALPPGGKYELVLAAAEHSAFTERALPGESGRRNPNHHRAILALSTAFWDAWLKEDATARAWLDGAGPRGVLEKEDRWQRK